MSFRIPQNLTSQIGSGTGPSPIEREIMGEKLASLGSAGRLVQQRLKELGHLAPQDPSRAAAVRMAADAVQSYFVQRELLGLINHDRPIEEYCIPTEVLSRLGAV